MQFIEKENNRTGKGWKVQRYRQEPGYFRTKDEAYQAAIQLYFNALAEEIWSRMPKGKGQSVFHTVGVGSTPTGITI